MQPAAVICAWMYLLDGITHCTHKYSGMNIHYCVIRAYHVWKNHEHVEVLFMMIEGT